MSADLGVIPGTSRPVRHRPMAEAPKDRRIRLQFLVGTGTVEMPGRWDASAGIWRGDKMSVEMSHTTTPDGWTDL